jgi:hypothetical protein
MSHDTPNYTTIDTSQSVLTLGRLVISSNILSFEAIHKPQYLQYDKILGYKPHIAHIIHSYYYWSHSPLNWWKMGGGGEYVVLLTFLKVWLCQMQWMAFSFCWDFSYSSTDDRAWTDKKHWLLFLEFSCICQKHTPLFQSFPHPNFKGIKQTFRAADKYYIIF